MKSKNLLLIFTRNPELGKVKTRLAKVIGDQSALKIYKFLLAHTVEVTKDLEVDKIVYYTNQIMNDDIWDNVIYQKRIQKGENLGEKMENAFIEGFKNGYSNIIVIGSDLFDIEEKDLKNAFVALEDNEYVIGPSLDGGYYLLGMKDHHPTIFKNKEWGTSTVLNNTLGDISKHNYKILDERNDVDIYEDIKENLIFKQLLKN